MNVCDFQQTPPGDATRIRKTSPTGANSRRALTGHGDCGLSFLWPKLLCAVEKLDDLWILTFAIQGASRFWVKPTLFFIADCESRKRASK